MPDKIQTWRDQIIEAMFDALPATSYYELMKKINSAKRWHISIGDVSNALTHLRRNSAEYGWSVPHIKRGMAGRRDKNRLFALLVDRDGHYELDSNPEAKVHLNNGAMATTQHAATMLSNEAAALRIAATATRSLSARARMNDLCDDFEYVVRKAKSLLAEIKRDAA